MWMMLSIIIASKPDAQNNFRAVFFLTDHEHIFIVYVNRIRLRHIRAVEILLLESNTKTQSTA